MNANAIQSLASAAQGLSSGARPAGGADLGTGVADFAQAMQAAEVQAQAALTGGGDPHALVTAMAEGKLAVETMVSVRDRVVEAYQEILRMPV